MAGNKKPGKKYNPNKKKGNVWGLGEKIIHICVDDLEAIAAEIYQRLPPFREGKATFSDRTTLMIRLQTGLNLLEHFEETDVEKLLNEGLKLVTDSRLKEERKIRKFTQDEYVLLTTCIGLVHRMARACDVWQQAQATKAAEDKYLIGSSDFEYVLQKVVN